ncbi:MAG: hypothetical protein U0176_22545 [Bacteroidia bacterium]
MTAIENHGSILCHGGTTTVTITGMGGVPPYLNTGSFVVGVGTHLFEIEDANGCTDTILVTVTEPDPLTAAINASTILCHGGTAEVTVIASGGTAPTRELAPSLSTLAVMHLSSWTPTVAQQLHRSLSKSRQHW